MNLRRSEEEGGGVGWWRWWGLEWLSGCGPVLMIFEDDNCRNECALVLSQFDHYVLLPSSFFLFLFFCLY